MIKKVLQETKIPVTKFEIVQKPMFKTEDGQLFSNLANAEDYEKKLVVEAIWEGMKTATVDVFLPAYWNMNIIKLSTQLEVDTFLNKHRNKSEKTAIFHDEIAINSIVFVDCDPNGFDDKYDIYTAKNIRKELQKITNVIDRLEKE
jgi:hypothetical protein